MMDKEKQEEEVDHRREAAIASSASLRPNFKPKNGITEAHLSKFQELHRRRLQIKAKSKIHKKSKARGLVDVNGNSNKTIVKISERTDEEPNWTIGDSSATPMSSKRVDDASAVGERSTAVNSEAKSRQKLYWGLDAKERWERKSNM